MHFLLPLLFLCFWNSIVGGARSEAGDYPFAVTLQVYNQVKKKWLTVCAGSIIDREWVLGAANCFYFGSRRTPADQYRIVAGSTRVTSTSTDDGITQVIQVADVVIHPEMKVDDKPNDELHLFIYNELALIKQTPQIRENSPEVMKKMQAKLTHLVVLGVLLQPARSIVGGHGVSVDSHNYAVAIRTRRNNRWLTVCSGSIIDAEWILTAGHCISNIFWERVT
ncbi:unnamed protein product, partial [Mesorhabditis spiculigera]